MPLKYLLSEDQLPRHWYNIIPDLPSPPAPVLHPGTLQPVKPDDLAPLFRARSLEQQLGTRSHIYYKYEGVSPSGSHKPNTAVAQAFYNAKAGVRRLATEMGVASPTNKTNAGRAILAQDPRSPGSLGIAISEAVEDAATHARRGASASSSSTCPAMATSIWARMISTSPASSRTSSTRARPWRPRWRSYPR